MKYFIALIILLSEISLFAQRYQKNDEIGLFIGGSYYEGDINFGTMFYKPELALGINLRRNFSPYMALKLEVIKAALRAYDADFPTNEYQIRRNSFFEDNHIVDLNLMFEYNFFPISDDKNKENISPYFTIGIALFHSTSLDNIANFAVPLGLGMKYKISPKWVIQAEWTYRFTFTDNLDGVSRISDSNNNYKKQYSFDFTNDLYSLFGIKIMYQFRKKSLECPGYE